MSTMLIDLEDRVITDTGSMVAKYPLLLRMALRGEDIKGLPYLSHPDVDLFHKHVGNLDKARVWIPNDEIMGPPLSSFNWNIPEPFASMDVADMCEDAIAEIDWVGTTYEPYCERLALELVRVEEQGMENFLRCLVWVTDEFRQNNILWGLGRGSSCASLVLYLLGINKVDPVRYDIPMEEFYK